MFLMKKLLASIGSTNIDARVRQNADTSGVSSGKGLNCSLEDIENSDYILVFGSNIRKEYPLVNVAIKNAVDNNKARVAAWNVCNYDFNYDVDQIEYAADNVTYIALSFVKKLFLCVQI